MLINPYIYAAPIYVSGGTVTYDGSYTVRTFDTNSNLIILKDSVQISYLLVAGIIQDLLEAMLLKVGFCIQYFIIVAISVAVE